MSASADERVANQRARVSRCRVGHRVSVRLRACEIVARERADVRIDLSPARAGSARKTMRKKPSLGRHAEAGTVDAQDAGLAQQREHVVLVGAARAAARPTASRRTPRAAPRSACPGIAFSTLGRERARARPARARNVDLMRAVAGQRRGDRVLHRSRAAQPAVRQLLDRRERVVEPRRRADHQPAGAPARREIRLRQARERDDRRVGIERRRAAAPGRRSRDRRRPRRPESSGRAARRTRSARAGPAAGYTAPVGLFGSMTTSTRVRGVTRLRR